MNSTFQIDTVDPDEREIAGYAFRVEGLNGVVTSAHILPTSLTPGLVSGVVEWQDPLCMSSLVSTEGDPSPWLQRLFLIYAAAGPTSTRHVPELSPQNWAMFWATFPDPEDEAGEQVRISLNRACWQATFASNNPRRLTVHLPISAELHALDAGSVLLEIASHQARQHLVPAE